MGLFALNLNWAYIIPILLVLILIHEWGHFITARWVGIKVEEFGFGLPPRVVGFVRNGVIYSINALPIGGFVRMLGEDRSSEDPASFSRKLPWQRALVVSAGALLNFLFAVILLAVIATGHGEPTYTGQPEIHEVKPGSPAEAAGWRAGDVFVQVAGSSIAEFGQLTPLIKQHAGQTIEVVVRRNGELVPTTVIPRANPPAGEGATGVVLARQRVEFVPVPFWQALPSGFGIALQRSGIMLDGLGRMVASVVDRSTTVGPIAGPIGMGQIVGEVVTLSPLPLWVTLLDLTAWLSLNLFLLNLLPLPALDGGRLVFIVIEMLRGRRVHPDREGVVHFVGLVLLLTLIVVISVFDVGRLVAGRSILP